MKFRYSAPAVLILTAAVVVVAITGIAQLLTSRLVHTAHEGDYDLMRRAFSSTLKSMEDEATSDAEIVASIPSVRAAFIRRDRLVVQPETSLTLSSEDIPDTLINDRASPTPLVDHSSVLWTA